MQTRLWLYMGKENPKDKLWNSDVWRYVSYITDNFVGFTPTTLQRSAVDGKT